MHLTDASGAFHPRVIAARLDAEGIRADVRGVGDWPWPATGTVRIYVREADLEVAAELLLFDQVEAVFL